jgi:hypothetical protein
MRLSLEQLQKEFYQEQLYVICLMSVKYVVYEMRLSLEQLQKEFFENSLVPSV